jgi:argininosuccinate synthase
VIERIVLAYSGSVRSSAAIPWLIGEYGVPVTALILDLGQGSELEQVRSRALALGASRAHVLDVRDEFARECILPALQDGVFQDVTTPTDALAYPLIARKLVEVGAIEESSAVAHAGDPAAHEAIESAVRGLNPGLRVIAANLAGPLSPETLADFARRHGLPVPGRPPYFDVVATLWGREVTCVADEGEWVTPPESVYNLTRSTARTPDVPAHVALEFDEGVPVSINGVPMPLTELIESVATIAGNHGVGRVTRPDLHRIYEAPAATILAEAHATLAGAGAGRPSGTVRMKLFRGEHTIVGHSPVAVHTSALTTHS